MECINCGSQLEANWTHCPHCGKFKSVFKQPITDEAVDGIYGRMTGGKSKDQDSGEYKGGSGSYGSGVRAQVFEVIVRQAIAGAPWREICEGPMAVNKITPDEVQAEVDRRRKAMGIKSDKKGKEDKSSKGKKTSASEKDKSTSSEKRTDSSSDEIHKDAHNENNEKWGFPNSPPRPPFDPHGVISPSIRLQKLYQKLYEFLEKALEDEQQKKYSHKLLAELGEIMDSILRMETLLHTIQTEISVTADLERELRRTSRPFEPPDHTGGPHRIDW